MIKNDAWIREQCITGKMIDPFVPILVREDMKGKRISNGLSSYGYDIRLSENEFKVFSYPPQYDCVRGVMVARDPSQWDVIDPKNFNPDFLFDAELEEDEKGKFFVLPGHSYGLGVALERLEIPDNITVICIGKSTYARCGIIANLTPGEAGWRGHLTLEFSNSSPAPCRIYANEGIVQLLFFEGDPCDITYHARNGKYQDQPQSVVVSKV